MTEIQAFTGCSRFTRIRTVSQFAAVRYSEREECRETHHIIKKAGSTFTLGIAIRILVFLFHIHNLGSDIQPVLDLSVGGKIEVVSLNVILLGCFKSTVVHGITESDIVVCLTGIASDGKVMGLGE